MSDEPENLLHSPHRSFPSRNRPIAPSNLPKDGQTQSGCSALIVRRFAVILGQRAYEVSKLEVGECVELDEIDNTDKEFV